MEAKYAEQGPNHWTEDTHDDIVALDARPKGLANRRQSERVCPRTVLTAVISDAQKQRAPSSPYFASNPPQATTANGRKHQKPRPNAVAGPSTRPDTAQIAGSRRPLLHTKATRDRPPSFGEGALSVDHE